MSAFGQMPKAASFVGAPAGLSGNQVGGQGQILGVNGKYSVGQDVTIYSESGKSWVVGKVTVVGADGSVTVQYGGNQKTVPLENQQTHLAPLNSSTGPQPAQPKPALTRMVSCAPSSISYAPSQIVSSAPTPSRMVSS